MASGLVPAWSSRLVFLLALLNLASVGFPHQRLLLNWPVDLGPLGTAMGPILSTATGVGLLSLARGLRRCGPTALIFVWMTLACWLLGCLITQADRDGLVPGWTWPDLILHAGVGMLGVAGPIRFVNQAAGTHSFLLLRGLGVVTAATTLLALHSTSTTAEPATAQDRMRVRSMLKTHGQLVPWGARGWSLDVMRRRAGLYSGMMELMIADVVESARERGIGKISLNFALFRSSLARAERVGAGPVLRARVRVLLFASRWWQIASLYRANAKRRPSGEPRFLCFPRARDLGDIVLAGAQAEGFLRLPLLLQKRLHPAGVSRAGAAR